MKILVLLIAVSCTIAVDLQAIETQPAARSVQTSKTINTIPVPQKQEQYYQQQYQQPQLQHPQLQQAQIQQSYPVQYVPTSAYQQQQAQTHPQPAMIIIAQPTPIPSQAMISHAAQHLLNYFNANPQARYQFLQGNYQPQQNYIPHQAPTPAYTYQVMTVQPQYQQIQSAQSQNSAPFIPSPQLSQQPIPVQLPQQNQQHSVQSSSAQQSYSQVPQIQIPVVGQFGYSTSIPHISTLAQLATQKYLPQIPLRSNAPAIITGLENFTPEQQAQIKEQLQTGRPITPLRSGLPPNFGANIQDDSTVAKTNSVTSQSTSAQEYPAPEGDKTAIQQVQAPTSSTYNSALGYSNQFTKG